MSNKKLNDQGFSLLEVIVALSIMAVGFVTILQLFSGSLRAIGIADEYLKGISLASHKLGELELDDFDTDTFSGRFDDEKDYSWVLDIEPYETILNNEDSNIAVLKVNLQVFWTDYGKERSVELVTLKTVGATFPSTDKVLLGTETTSIYGNVAGGGAVKLALSGSDTELTSPPEEEETREVSFCGNKFIPVDISGFRANASSANISGFGQ